MAALTAVLAILGIYLPFLQLVVFFIWTIPVIITTVRHGLSVGISSVLVAGLLIFMLSSPLQALVTVLRFGGLALFYGFSFRKNWNLGITLFMGTAIAIISTLTVFTLSFLVTDLNPFYIADQLKENIEPTIEFYRNLGAFNPERGFTEESVRQDLTMLVQLMKLLFPALLAFAGMLSAFLSYFVAQKVLSKLKIPTPRFVPFRNWRLPWWSVWGLLIGLGAQQMGNYLNREILSVIGLNMMVLFGIIFFIMGLSTVTFFVHKYFTENFIYRFLVFLIIFMFMPITLWTLALIGLFDVLFNYRRLSGDEQVQ